MTRNRLSDLNDHLFAQLERLGEEDLVGDDLLQEINRAKAVTGVASQVISNANLLLQAAEFTNDHPFGAQKALPRMLEP